MVRRGRNGRFVSTKRRAPAKRAPKRRTYKRKAPAKKRVYKPRTKTYSRKWGNRGLQAAHYKRQIAKEPGMYGPAPYYKGAATSSSGPTNDEIRAQIRAEAASSNPSAPSISKWPFNKPDPTWGNAEHY